MTLEIRKSDLLQKQVWDSMMMVNDAFKTCTDMGKCDESATKCKEACRPASTPAC